MGLLVEYPKYKKSSSAVLFVFALVTLNGCGGGYAAPPTQPQSAPLTITSANPPNGVVALAYGPNGNGFALTASGGAPPYAWTWTASPGSSLPPGLTLTNGVISGSPTTADSYSVNVQVSDSGSTVSHVTTNYSITISPSDLAITSGPPSSGVAGASYGQQHQVSTPRGPTPAHFFQLTATGGSGNFLWSWAADAGSSLPPGLVCCQAFIGTSSPIGRGFLVRGIIIGVPTTPGDYHVTITATDAALSILGVSAHYTISIASPPPPVVNVLPSPAIGTVNSPYPGFTFTATNGLPPSTWNETGALPSGLMLDASGLLSGTPAASGAFPISVQATDSVGQTSAPQNFNIQVLMQGFLPTGSLAASRALHTASLLQNGKVLVVGGANDNGEVNSSELFDATTRMFSAAGNLNTARHSHTATVLADGRVLVAGGSNGNTLNTAEIFDPSSGAFSITGNLTAARSVHTATLLQNGKVLVTGGFDAGGVPAATAELFDPAAGTFTALPNLSTARAYHSATLLANGKVLIAGGIDATGSPLATTEIFDSTAGSFAATASLITPRFQHTATRLDDGTVLLVGGDNAVGNGSTAEVFDPVAGMFTSTGNTEAFRTAHGASILANGQVLLVGGMNVNTVPVSSSEIFDPVGKTFSRTADLSTPRSGHTATLLNNGQVLVIGGSDVNAHALASAELYH